MILALVFQRPDVTTFLGELSADDFLMWADFYNRSPWGPGRDDQRQTVLLSYLSRAFAGGTGDLPNLTFPYFSAVKLNEAELLTLAEETHAALEPHEGGYRWRDGKKPQSLIDAEERLARERKEQEDTLAPRLW